MFNSNVIKNKINFIRVWKRNWSLNFILFISFVNSFNFDACAGFDTEMSSKLLDMYVSFICCHTNQFERRRSAQSVERQLRPCECEHEHVFQLDKSKWRMTACATTDWFSSLSCFYRSLMYLCMELYDFNLYTQPLAVALQQGCIIHIQYRCSSFDEIKRTKNAMFTFIFLSFLSIFSLKTVDLKWFYEILQKINISPNKNSFFFLFVFKVYFQGFQCILSTRHTEYLNIRTQLALQNISFGWHSWLSAIQQLWQCVPTVASSIRIVDMVDHMFAMQSATDPKLQGVLELEQDGEERPLGGECAVS